MAFEPLIRRMSHFELQIHSLENYLNQATSEPMSVMSCGLLSYFFRSYSEDSYV